MATKHPDSYFRLYPKDFFEAVDGYSNDVVAGYLRALSKYRGHFHCEGLPAGDDDYLRRLCQIEGMNWTRSKGIIFGHFFKLENGAWHQKRMREDYVTDCEEYQKQLARTETARAHRWPESSVTETETESVTETETEDATESATSLQPRTKNQEPRTSKEKKRTTVRSLDDATEVLGSNAPAIWSDESFRSAYALWIQYRIELGKPITNTACRGQVAECGRMGAQRAAAAIQHSIAKQWQGIYEEKSYGNQRSNTGAASSVKPTPGKYAGIAIKA